MKYPFLHSLHVRMNSPIVVVIDGIIGAGKSVFIYDYFVKVYPDAVIVDEPLTKWKDEGTLKRFYDDPSRRAYQFQTRVFHDRIMECRNKYRENPHAKLFVLERSIFTDVLFMKAMKKDGLIDESEYKDYMDLWKMWSELMPFKPSLFIYLSPEIEVAMNRLKSRGREEEMLISREYQLSLKEVHDDFFNTRHPVPVIVLNNSGDVSMYESFHKEIDVIINSISESK